MEHQCGRYQKPNTELYKVIRDQKKSVKVLCKLKDDITKQLMADKEND